MEAASISEMSANMFQTARRNISSDSHLQTHQRKFSVSESDNK
jgi:hypothetical protein